MAKTPHPNSSPIKPNPSVVVALTEILDLSISNISAKLLTMSVVCCASLGLANITVESILFIL